VAGVLQARDDRLGGAHSGRDAPRRSGRRLKPVHIRKSYA
jgi:hypothetical protein